jgi:hypothetical protein
MQQLEGVSSHRKAYGHRAQAGNRRCNRDEFLHLRPEERTDDSEQDGDSRDAGGDSSMRR